MKSHDVFGFLKVSSDLLRVLDGFLTVSGVMVSDGFDLEKDLKKHVIF